MNFFTQPYALPHIVHYIVRSAAKAGCGVAREYRLGAENNDAPAVGLIPAIAAIRPVPAAHWVHVAAEDGDLTRVTSHFRSVARSVRERPGLA